MWRSSCQSRICVYHSCQPKRKMPFFTNAICMLCSCVTCPPPREWVQCYNLGVTCAHFCMTHIISNATPMSHFKARNRIPMLNTATDLYRKCCKSGTLWITSPAPPLLWIYNLVRQWNAPSTEVRTASPTVCMRIWKQQKINNSSAPTSRKKRTFSTRASQTLLRPGLRMSIYQCPLPGTTPIPASFAPSWWALTSQTTAYARSILAPSETSWEPQYIED